MDTRRTSRPPSVHDRISLWLAFLLVGILSSALVITPPRVEPVVTPEPARLPAPARPEVLTTADGGPAGVRTVALTFDDGPDPDWTPRIVEVLQRHGAVGTFCMVGSAAAEHPDVVEQVVTAGMRLCNHSQDHDLALSTREPGRQRSDLLGATNRLSGATGTPVSYFRAPGGYWTHELQTQAAGEGMRPLGWSVDTRDWKQPGVNVILDRVAGTIHPGAIVLLHDGGGRRAHTVEALDRLLPWLYSHGYVTVFPTP